MARLVMPTLIPRPQRSISSSGTFGILACERFVFVASAHASKLQAGAARILVPHL